MNVYDQLGMEVMPKEYLPDDYTGICAGTTQDITGKCVYPTGATSLYDCTVTDRIGSCVYP